MVARRPSDALAAPRSSGPLANWAGNHASICGNAFGRLIRQPFASLMTVLVIAVTLALPAAMLLVIKNAASISGSWASALDFSVYLNADQSEDDARRLAQIVGQRADVESVTLVTAEDALAEFKSASGFGAALDHLTVNPLPHALVVRPSDANTEQSMSLLNEELGNLPETDFVQVDTEWVQRFHAILETLQRAVTMVAGLLGAAILVVIGNTIRLDIQNRREEIAAVVAWHALYHRRQTLESHARVHRGRRQRPHGAVGALLELHEDQVPDLEVAVTVAARPAVRPPTTD